MGGKATKIESTELDPGEIFKTRDDVHNLLVTRLYETWDDLRPRLVALFEERVSIDQNTHQKYWTQESFVSYLVSQNDDLRQVIQDAGPLLFRFAITRGSYPFPASISSPPLLIPSAFLIFIAILSHLQNDVFVTIDWLNRHHCATRQKPRDEHRLFFQNLANHLPENTHSDTSDEDLLDVLCSVQPSQDFGKGLHSKWARSDIKPAASLLPSSDSTNLSGRISVSNMRLLIRFCIVVIASHQDLAPADGNWDNVVNQAAENVLEFFTIVERGDEPDGIGWEIFSRVCSESIPYLLDPLKIFFSVTFSIPETEISAPLPLKNTKISSPPQLALPIFAFQPALSSLTTLIPQGTSLFTQLQLQHPHHLLLLNSKPPAIQSQTPQTTLAIFISHHYYTGSPASETDNDSLPSSTTDITVLELAPRFGQILTGNAIVIEFRDGIVVEVKGKGTVNISYLSFQLNSRNGGSVKFEIEDMEVWGSD